MACACILPGHECVAADNWKEGADQWKVVVVVLLWRIKVGNLSHGWMADAGMETRPNC